MTVTTTTAGAPPRPRLDPKRLWLPVAAAMVVIIFTIVTAVIESPSPGNDDFLSPEAEGGHGSAILAQRLAESGVTVDRFTDAKEAFVSVDGDTTVFIPAPEYLNADELARLADLRTAPVRLVLVTPPMNYLAAVGLHESTSRIATKTVDSGSCGLAEAEAAGEASMLRQPYGSDGDGGQFNETWKFCYDGGLAWNDGNGFEQVIAGAADPFTDAFIGEAGNEALATGLLGANQRLVWLDKHSLAPEPEPSRPTPPTASPPPSQTSEPQREPIEYPEAGDPAPIYGAMPAWVWAGLIGLVLLGVLTALWRGRRLGSPVTEPLPTTVPAAETVHGRARLYRRAHAYPEALRALRAGALHRLRPILRVSSQARDNEVVAAVTARTGWPAEQVEAILFSTEPTTEAELMTATSALDALVAAVENARPQGSN